MASHVNVPNMSRHAPESEEGRWPMGNPDWGFTFYMLLELRFGPRAVARASFGVNMGGIDAENQEESEHRPHMSPRFHKRSPTSKLRFGLPILFEMLFGPKPPGVFLSENRWDRRTKVRLV